MTKSHIVPMSPTTIPFRNRNLRRCCIAPIFPVAMARLRVPAASAAIPFNGAIGLMTPMEVHCGQAEAVAQVRRREVLSPEFKAHPEHFVRGMPKAPQVPKAGLINKTEIESKDRLVPKNNLAPGIGGMCVGSRSSILGHFGGRLPLPDLSRVKERAQIRVRSVARLTRSAPKGNQGRRG